MLPPSRTTILALSEVVSQLVIPIALLVVGAILSGMLIPALTRRRDDYRKTQEIKTELVSEMSEVVTEFVMAIQFAMLGAQEQRGYDEAFRSWEVRSAVIGTKLEAYFPGTAVGERWRAFCVRVAAFYATTGIDDPDRRSKAVGELLDHYGLRDAERVTRAVSGAGRPSMEDQLEWGRLKDAVQGENAGLIRAVLELDGGGRR